MNSFLNRDEPIELTDPESARQSMLYAKVFLLTAVILTLFGLTMLYSTSYGVAGPKYFAFQLIWAGVGSVGGLAMFVIGFRRIARYSVLWIIISFVLLVITALCFAPINGASRWMRFRIGGLQLSLQPSEFAKLAVAVFVAKYCSDNMRTFNLLRHRRGIVPVAVGAGAVIGGILLGRDLGTTVLVSVMALGTMLAAGLWLRHLTLPAIFAGLIGIYVFLFDPTRLSRVTSFTQAEVMRREQGYQLWNSLMAFGSGGVNGVGFMGSRLKASYLPEAHTDFILAIVGEELGLIAMLGVLVCYALFTWSAYKISVNSSSRLGMLTAFALMLGISVQAIINIAVVTGSAPTKGMPAPFLSYGGTNLAACLTAVGLILSVAADTISPGYNDRLWLAAKRKLSFLPQFKEYREE
ncbi:MAG: FtsW/RodA/SpoVE family cell cycle protein [Victivallaceae bacterium]|nr:FtsW/RodA/SpoVE family cell cycle protein [Victivallaceae bacterium]